MSSLQNAFIDVPSTGTFESSHLKAMHLSDQIGEEVFDQQGPK